MFLLLKGNGKSRYLGKNKIVLLNQLSKASLLELAPKSLSPVPELSMVSVSGAKDEAFQKTLMGSELCPPY